MGNEGSKTEKKKLGVTELACYGIGNCIGSGLFVSMGVSIAHTGSSITLALLVSCIVVLFAYAYKTLLSGMFVLPGGNYSVNALLQPPLLVGISATMEVLSGIGFAMFGLSIVEYAADVFPGILNYKELIAITIITLFFLTTLLGGKFMGKLNMVMVVVLIASLAVYTVVGLPQVDYASVNPAREDYFRNGAMGFITAVATMAFACQGATMPIAMSPDAKDPKRSLPKAILLASGVVTVIYCLIGIVSSGILPVEEVAGKNLGVVAKEIFPYPVFVIFILGGACFAIATSLYGAIASRQHPLMATIKDGWLPAWLGKTTKNGYPWVLMLLLYATAIVPIFLDLGLQALISMMMIPTALVNLLNNFFMFPLIKRYPNAWKNGFFKFPKAVLYGIIVLAILSNVLIIAALLMTLKAGEQWAILLVMLVLIAYSYYRLKANKVNLHDIEKARQEVEAAAAASTNM